MGQVYEQELRDLDRAIEAFNDVLSVEADHADALAGLARLYEETEQWERAVEVMRRLIRVSTDPRQKVDLNYRLGKIFDEQMQDAGARRGVPGRGAVAWIPPTSRRCCRCSSIYKRRGDWLKAAQLMVRAEAAHQQPAGEDAPAVRGRQDLPGEAGRRGAGRRAVRARAAARSRARRGGRAAVASSTSSARSGRRWFRSSRCWRARPIARPTAS